MIVILLYIIVGFIPGNNTDKKTFADAIPIKQKVEIVSSKDHLPSGNHEIIMERNIFSSSGLRQVKENPQRKYTNPLARVIKTQVRLLATIAGDDQVACAVIENLKSKVQDIYKVGDTINGAKIESIDRNKIVLLFREKREVLHLQIACEVLVPIEKNEESVMSPKQRATESINPASLFEKEIDKRTFITQIPGIEVFLEKTEVTPYIINGKPEGLCITGLDDLSMAGYFGFESGDVIQTINEQTLTDKQKAFQVLKKARSQSSLNFQLLRNKHKMNLAFETK